jgi:N-acetylmuramoyl-L-alanine amidase
VNLPVRNWHRFGHRSVVYRVLVAATAVAVPLSACTATTSARTPSAGVPMTSVASTTTPAPSTPATPASPSPSPSSSSLSGFPPNACVALPPTSGARGVTVFLDAGHGGPDPGGLGTTTAGRHVAEKDVTLPVAAQTATRLRAAGFRVVMSRTADTAVIPLQPADLVNGTFTTAAQHAELLARVRCANAAGAAVLVSIHFNAGGSPRNAGALTAYDAVRPFSQRNEQLATALQHAVVQALNAKGWQIPDVGVVADTTIGNATSAQGVAYGHLVLLGPPKPGYVDVASAMPGAVVEPLFLTDPFEADIATSADGQDVIASALAGAITQYLSGA